MLLLYHAYVYLEFLILACTIYILAPLLLLREDERKLIYQHVFEERTFDDISRINDLPPYKVKGIYYYAIRKIRKWMGGVK